MIQNTGPQPGGCRTEGLTGLARQVHQAVLAAFGWTGQPPARGELEQLARNLGAHPDAVLAELAETDAAPAAATPRSPAGCSPRMARSVSASPSSAACCRPRHQPGTRRRRPRSEL